MPLPPSPPGTPIATLEARLEAESRPPTTTPVAHVDALVDLAWALRSADVPRANALATNARGIARDSGYKLGQAWAARTMALTIVDDDGLRQIWELAEEAKALFDEVEDLTGRAASRDFLATLHEHVGNLTAGLELALDALSLARALGDPVRQAYALSNVGGILAESGDVDEGIERLNEALSLFRQVDDADGMGTICSRLSKILRQAGQTERALSYAAWCLEIAEDTDNEFLHWTAYSVLAEVAEERGDLAEAERKYRAALDALRSDMTREVVGLETMVSLGRLHIATGAYDDAEAQLARAVQLAGRDGVFIVAEAKAHETLAELFERQERFAEAIGHLRRAQTLRTQVAQRDARNKVRQVELRAAMDAAKKDAEIHRLKYVELHEMQSKLVEAKKMAFLGKLAAGAAHELNTPLGVLRSNTALTLTVARRALAKLPHPDDDAMKLAAALEAGAKTTEHAVERIFSVAASLERFTQVDQAERRTFDVRDGLSSAVALLRPTISSRIELTQDFEEVPPVDGWSRAVNHAFMTVLQNALESIEGDGVVRVETRATPDEVLVHIRDSGRGMSSEQVAHLFDVGWSQGDRTSMRLGLSAAYATMTRQGGRIDVDSQAGSGTVITFRFPRPAE